MLFFRSYFFKGSETDLNKLVQKQLALNSTITILEKLQAIRTTQHGTWNIISPEHRHTFCAASKNFKI